MEGAGLKSARVGHLMGQLPKQRRLQGRRSCDSGVPEIQVGRVPIIDVETSSFAVDPVNAGPLRDS
eukprot:1244985-Pyramimonas_sp.AAC.1